VSAYLCLSLSLGSHVYVDIVAQYALFKRESERENEHGRVCVCERAYISPSLSFCLCVSRSQTCCSQANVAVWAIRRKELFKNSVVAVQYSICHLWEIWVTCCRTLFRISESINLRLFRFPHSIFPDIFAKIGHTDKLGIYPRPDWIPFSSLRRKSCSSPHIVRFCKKELQRCQKKKTLRISTTCISNGLECLRMRLWAKEKEKNPVQFWTQKLKKQSKNFKTWSCKCNLQIQIKFVRAYYASECYCA